jgi:DNA-binding Xre family transcriptional regulator
MKPNSFHIGESIAEVMDRKKVSKRDLSVKLNMSEVNIYKILKKESLNTELLIKIAEALGCLVTEFFGYSSGNETTRERKLEEKITELEELVELSIYHLTTQIQFNKSLWSTNQAFSIIFSIYGEEIRDLVPKNERIDEIQKSIKTMASMNRVKPDNIVYFKPSEDFLMSLQQRGKGNNKKYGDKKDR